MKKSLILTVTLILVLVCLASCSKVPGTESPSKPPVTIDDYYFPNLPEAGAYDFGGETMVVNSHHGNGFAQRGDTMRRFTQDLHIEQRFNVKIAYSTNFDQHMNDAIAGKPSADISFLMNHQMTQYIKGGALEPLQDYAEQLHLGNNDRYDQELIDWCTINDSVYGVGVKPEELWKYHYVIALFMNKDLLQNRGINADEIYTLQENKEWTWAKFKDYAKRVTNDMNGDGIPDIYGTTVGVDNMLDALMISNGTNYIKQINGKFTFDVDSKGIAVLNYMKELVTDGAARTTESNGGFPSTQDTADFLNGKIGFQPIVFQRTWVDGSVKDMTYSYGVLSMPMGPDVTDYYYTDSMYAVYAMFAQPDKENAKKIAEFIYIYTTSLFESEEDERQSYWDEANNRIFDDGSEYFLNRIFEQTNVIRTNNIMFTYVGLGAMFSVEPVIGGTKTAQQLVEEVAAPCQSFIDTLFAA